MSSSAMPDTKGTTATTHPRALVYHAFNRGLVVNYLVFYWASKHRYSQLHRFDALIADILAQAKAIRKDRKIDYIVRGPQGHFHAVRRPLMAIRARFEEDMLCNRMVKLCQYRLTPLVLRRRASPVIGSEADANDLYKSDEEFESDDDHDDGSSSDDEVDPAMLQAPAVTMADLKNPNRRPDRPAWTWVLNWAAKSEPYEEFYLEPAAAKATTDEPAAITQPSRKSARLSLQPPMPRSEAIDSPSTPRPSAPSSTGRQIIFLSPSTPPPPSSSLLSRAATGPDASSTSTFTPTRNKRSASPEHPRLSAGNILASPHFVSPLRPLHFSPPAPRVESPLAPPQLTPPAPRVQSPQGPIVLQPAPKPIDPPPHDLSSSEFNEDRPSLTPPPARSLPMATSPLTTVSSAHESSKSLNNPHFHDQGPASADSAIPPHLQPNACGSAPLLILAHSLLRRRSKVAISLRFLLSNNQPWVTEAWIQAIMEAHKAYFATEPDCASDVLHMEATTVQRDPVDMALAVVAYCDLRETRKEVDFDMVAQSRAHCVPVHHLRSVSRKDVAHVVDVALALTSVVAGMAIAQAVQVAMAQVALTRQHVWATVDWVCAIIQGARTVHGDCSGMDREAIMRYAA
ncbi:hypothetical protein BCR44DRAFT_1430667 [Catenaria anguillulae PL171]|uniref:Uncharacterized protein n=1 Tax=Catenaria anguillulae PL171 TaxID=765915 RepID=A0A1Y2HRH9_9FUNG|nr:hypothetical protein BCR44DRAFT_1430667 [Catenaria anguillulae PL171]